MLLGAAGATLGIRRFGDEGAGCLTAVGIGVGSYLGGRMAVEAAHTDVAVARLLGALVGPFVIIGGVFVLVRLRDALAGPTPPLSVPSRPRREEGALAASSGERTITMDDLLARIGEICRSIETEGQVWFVVTASDSVEFVLGPQAVCGRMLGLKGPEYGWPCPVDIDAPLRPEDLRPGRQRHPVLVRAGREVAFAISPEEYSRITAGTHRQDPQRPID